MPIASVRLRLTATAYAHRNAAHPMAKSTRSTTSPGPDNPSGSITASAVVATKRPVPAHDTLTIGELSITSPSLVGTAVILPRPPAPIAVGERGRHRRIRPPRAP